MFVKLLQNRIQHGRLILRMPDGTQHLVGDKGPEAHWLIHSPKTPGRILRDPELALGETYIDGQWDAGDGGLSPLLHLLMRNFPQSASRVNRLFEAPLNMLRSWNRLTSSRRNVAHHYDLDEWLFRRFLDSDMQYSCAYFERPDATLETAQRAKCRHLSEKLLLKPGQRILDIGSGWGGLALYLAEQADVEVTGLTLSREQLRVARTRARERGLERRVRFELQDYREHTGSYDRIVSVGMFEHVGTPHHTRYFKEIERQLAPDGVAVIHTIGHFGPTATTNAWIRRYVFPGGVIPSLNDVTCACDKAGLITTDLEVLRMHYAYTLERWLQRFHQYRNEIKARMGERFLRLWEFYLASCEAAFHWRGLAVFQVQLSKTLDTVPITRKYLYAENIG